MSLMKEVPSCNVTHILDIELGGPGMPHHFDIINHGKGVFEFNPIACLRTDKGKEYILEKLKRAFDTYQQHDAVYPVTITGLKTTDDDQIGSQRFCTMDYSFAQYLTNVIQHRSVVDIIQSQNQWFEMINVSQYFRFMKYSRSGEHYPHYDSDFEYQYNNAITKYSVVVYFNDCDSGELAFIDDNTPNAYNFSDWPQQAEDREIWLKIKPSYMKIVLFPHKLCHTVLPFIDKDNIRYICRGDILFSRCKQ